MREEQKILNHHINIDGKDGNANILQQLQGVTKQRVDQLDYQQQIERWNRYQALLDGIDKKCGRHVGVRLARNVKHNFRVFTDVSYAGLSIIGIVALMVLWSSFSTNSIYGIIGSITALGFVGWQTLIRLYHPSIIHFKCSPVLHIDEFAYMRQAIKAIPLAEHDPIVRLPVLEMSVSRAWLAQQGMLKFMESLSDIKLEKAMEEKKQQGQQLLGEG
jgi:hypothetical protein